MVESIRVAICIEVNLKHLMNAMIVQTPIISEEIQFISVNHHENTTPKPTRNEITSIGLISHKKGVLIFSLFRSHKV
jgi:hypothetical protein